MKVVLWALLALVVLCAGCSGVAPAPEGAQEPAWTATFEQDRPDQASPNAHVKLTSSRRHHVTVDGVRLRWSGYRRDGWQPADMSYAPGHVHRLQVRLPRPRCDGGGADRPHVQVRLADGSTDRVALDAAGAGLLRQIWQQDCREQRLLEAVDISLERWRLVRRSGDLVLRGELVARRGDSPAEVMLAETRGSVLLHLEPLGAGRVLLAPAAGRGRVPVVVSSAGRCDPHSLGGSTQTFTFRVWVSLDGGPEQPLVMVPDARARRHMQTVIAVDCGLR
ncbi:MAG: hypothetical protein M3211_13315 [Actinomycetota bacterium]|nr:hypothetical protein [Actinomycetota bacterium]